MASHWQNELAEVWRTHLGFVILLVVLVELPRPSKDLPTGLSSNGYCPGISLINKKAPIDDNVPRFDAGRSLMKNGGS